MLLSRILRLILDSVGKSDEYEYYLRRFRKIEGGFALLCPDETSFREAFDILHFHLDFLRRLELYPILVLTGPSAAKNLGHFQDPDDLEILDLTDRTYLREHSVESDEMLRRELNQFYETIRRNKKPGALVHHNIMPASLIVRTAPILSRRLHIIRMSGALLDENGLELEYCDPEMDPKKLHRADRGLFSMMRDLYRTLPEHHISVTSPVNLLREIFTIRGAGTMLHKSSSVGVYSSLSELDRDRLWNLLLSSFNTATMGEHVLEETGKFYLADDYRGAALLVDTPMGMYLSKFAVGPEARGLGIAQDIWKKMLERESRIFWRSSFQNNANNWYLRIADGHHHGEKWNIYWKGTHVGHIPEIIQWCEDRPADMVYSI